MTALERTCSGIREHARVVSTIADVVEGRHPIVVTGDGFPVDDTGPRAEPSYPITGIADCCARAASGRPTAAPP
jgi:hypothetical protein